MSKPFAPFANEADALDLDDDFHLDNHEDRVSLYGSLDLTEDKQGLALAKALKAVVDATVAALEREKALPDRVAPPDAPATVKNPFA